jgi:ribonuclease HI
MMDSQLVGKNLEWDTRGHGGTDGGEKLNMSEEGWGGLIRPSGRETYLCGGEARASNDTIGLMAVVSAAHTLKSGVRAWVSTDSR